MYRIDRFKDNGLYPITGIPLAKTKEELIPMVKQIHGRLMPVVIRNLSPEKRTSKWLTPEQAFGSCVERMLGASNGRQERKPARGKRAFLAD